MSPSSVPLPLSFNYAKALGYNSTPAAIVFAIFYVPLVSFFAWKSLKHPTYFHLILVIFCTIRLIAFIIRAILSGNESAGESLGLLITDEVLFGVGFAGLLYSSYTLILDRYSLHSKSMPRTSSSRISQLLLNRSIFRVALVTGVGLGIAASTRTSNASHGTDGTTRSLHEASTLILLILTTFLAILALLLLRQQMRDPPLAHHSYEPTGPNSGAANSPNMTLESNNYTQVGIPFGQSYGAQILCLVSFLLLVREAFNTGTVQDSKRGNEEQLWYPFVALPEVLAVVLFMIPGLVPMKTELPR
ncbi:hypothetical protein CVT24_011739 [Panaeolus cyanescens]|uniref:DUF7702 domain-containing protein n=1 Tax=Panaeolus cyanescens TaxID=181874 RepID=A0A409YNG8_9AGAR|nr:hypothetical protein CVT24_011739 [Panaeolus cyanescens]